MAKIKCRYGELRCEYDWIDSFWPEECEGPECACRYYEPDPCEILVVNPSCAHLQRREREFEKTYKSYELDEHVLHVRGRAIARDDMDYLEIDGRVLEGGEDDE